MRVGRAGAAQGIQRFRSGRLLPSPERDLKHASTPGGVRRIYLATPFSADPPDSREQGTGTKQAGRQTGRDRDQTGTQAGRQAGRIEQAE